MRNASGLLGRPSSRESFFQGLRSLYFAHVTGWLRDDEFPMNRQSRPHKEAKSLGRSSAASRANSARNVTARQRQDIAGDRPPLTASQKRLWEQLANRARCCHTTKPRPTNALQQPNSRLKEKGNGFLLFSLPHSLSMPSVYSVRRSTDSASLRISRRAHRTGWTSPAREGTH